MIKYFYARYPNYESLLTPIEKPSLEEFNSHIESKWLYPHSTIKDDCNDYESYCKFVVDYETNKMIEDAKKCEIVCYVTVDESNELDIIKQVESSEYFLRWYYDDF